MQCKWSVWTRWSKCSKSCGGGSQKRRRTIARTAKHGGKRCDGSNTARQSCNIKKCPGMINLNLYIYLKHISSYSNKCITWYLQVLVSFFRDQSQDMSSSSFLAKKQPSNWLYYLFYQLRGLFFFRETT